MYGIRFYFSLVLQPNVPWPNLLSARISKQIRPHFSVAKPELLSLLLSLNCPLTNTQTSASLKWRNLEPDQSKPLKRPDHPSSFSQIPWRRPEAGPSSPSSHGVITRPPVAGPSPRVSANRDPPRYVRGLSTASTFQ